MKLVQPISRACSCLRLLSLQSTFSATGSGHSLPAAITRLSGLTALNLCDADVRKLPSQLSTMTALRLLRLVDSGETPKLVRHTLGVLPGLQALEATHLSWRDAFGTGLTKLVLECSDEPAFENDIGHLVRQLPKLIALAHLSISGCHGVQLQMPQLCNTLSALPQLRSVGFPGCGLRSLPQELGALAAVTYLCLALNDYVFTQGMAPLAPLNSCRVLNLSGCGLTHLTATVCQTLAALPALECVYTRTFDPILQRPAVWRSGDIAHLQALRLQRHPGLPLLQVVSHDAPLTEVVSVHIGLDECKVLHQPLKNVLPV